jgi:hypothetical protein
MTQNYYEKRFTGMAANPTVSPSGSMSRYGEGRGEKKILIN